MRCQLPRPAAPEVALDREAAGCVAQLLVDVLADARKQAAAGTVRVLGPMPDLGERHLGWQRLVAL